jgi:hypothetical protein
MPVNYITPQAVIEGGQETVTLDYNAVGAQQYSGIKGAAKYQYQDAITGANQYWGFSPGANGTIETFAFALNLTPPDSPANIVSVPRMDKPVS